MPTIKPGDVAIVDFAGAMGVKRRPAVVVSSDDYHAARPDAIIGLLTTQVARATTAMDHVVADWKSAGLRAPSAFRSYLVTVLQSDLHIVGHLIDSDWKAVRDCMSRALA